MVRTRTKSTLYNTDSSFGETINKFQDCNIKNKNKKKQQNSPNKQKNIRTLERKKEKAPKQLGFDFWIIVLVGKVFANGPEDQVSIPGRVIPKTFKMVLDTSLLNTRHYKVRIKGKVEKSEGRSSAFPYTSV